MNTFALHKKETDFACRLTDFDAIAKPQLIRINLKNEVLLINFKST
jgi:hypothetical protein